MAINEEQTKPIQVFKLLEKKLKIDDYQRPYKWQPKQINQLIDDILYHRDKEHYRLGTVVLHKKEEKGEDLYIVDGQQRLITLTLLCKILDKSYDSKQLSLLDHEFDSTISIQNIKHNAQLISDRLSDLNQKEKQELLKFICENCELIQVILDDISEAFQFFDSQNARGKELEPHDLLKAYHLRSMMDSTTEKERLHHVNLWEQGINPENPQDIKLATIMGDYPGRDRTL